MKNFQLNLKKLLLDIAFVNLFIYLIIWLINSIWPKSDLILFPHFFAINSLIFFALYQIYGAEPDNI